MPTFSLGPNFFQSTIFYSSKPTRARSGPLIPWVRSLFTISNWMVLNWLDDIRYWSTPYPKWSHLICVERSPHWHPGVFWLHRSSCCLPFYANESSAWCVFFCKTYVFVTPQAAAGMMLPCWMMVSKDQHQGLKKKHVFWCVFLIARDWRPCGWLLTENHLVACWRSSSGMILVWFSPSCKTKQQHSVYLVRSVSQLSYKLPFAQPCWMTPNGNSHLDPLSSPVIVG